MGTASAPQDLLNTRAGGQDDVSSNKLPQINKIGIKAFGHTIPDLLVRAKGFYGNGTSGA